MKKETSVLVLGGGASGMVAAITAASQGAKVVLLEHNMKLGKKLLATGNGKCNLTNQAMGEQFFRGGSTEFVKERLEQFGEKNTIEFFEALGLLTKERKGYVYPSSESAASVVSVLTLGLRQWGVEVCLGVEVRSIEKTENGFVVLGTQKIVEESTTKEKNPKDKYSKEKSHKKSVVTKNLPRSYRADKVIVCLGSCAGNNLGESYDGINIAKSFGHTIVEPKPALVSLKLNERALRTLSGVRQEAAVRIHIDNDEHFEQGEIIFADYGISGIPIMQLSRHVSEALRKGNAAKIKLRLDFFPQYTKDSLEALLLKHITSEYTLCRTGEETFAGILPSKLLYVLLLRAGIAPEEKATVITPKQISLLADEMKAMALEVQGTNGFDKAQVMTGGVTLTEITSEFESNLVPGLYFAGELLDVDGTCGGYNLQWAWTSGAIAGKACLNK